MKNYENELLKFVVTRASVGNEELRLVKSFFLSCENRIELLFYYLFKK